MAKLATPDLTWAQKIGFLAVAVPNAVVLFGYHLSTQQADALDKIMAAAAGLVATDAVIRVGRSISNGRVEAAKATAESFSSSLPVLPDEGDAPPADDMNVPTAKGQ